ncbi:hypothetical protein BDA99DRAFT_558800 [Phascolomyces articulosus]|uniref:Subtilisin inhibitor domain-containing protein n=1 Tax=Phascolomyces articulosus TaxID=60185 RepID=A0AAD5K2U2_9FUNG|nr:hypothetical protein BDA99DRAFT_558800 [Phascolomyces articulosus]
MKYYLALSLFMAAGIVNASSSNVTIPAQTNIEISVVENLIIYEWQLICYQHSESGGTHPEGKEACSEISQLQVSLGDAIEKAEPSGICPTIVRPANLTIDGIVGGKETLFTEEYTNSCYLKNTMSGAELPSLVPFNEDGTYNTGKSE